MPPARQASCRARRTGDSGRRLRRDRAITSAASPVPYYDPGRARHRDLLRLVGQVRVGRREWSMTVMHVLRRAAAPAAAAGLAVSCLLAAGPPAQAGPATLHLSPAISLGKLGRDFSYQFTEDPGGNVFYFRGSAVYEVKITASKPNTALRVRGAVLAVAASSSGLFVDVGRTVTEYKREPP